MNMQGFKEYLHNLADSLDGDVALVLVTSTGDGYATIAVTGADQTVTDCMETLLLTAAGYQHGSLGATVN